MYGSQAMLLALYALWTLLSGSGHEWRLVAQCSEYHNIMFCSL